MFPKDFEYQNVLWHVQREMSPCTYAYFEGVKIMAHCQLKYTSKINKTPTTPVKHMVLLLCYWHSLLISATLHFLKVILDAAFYSILQDILFHVSSKYRA